MRYRSIILNDLYFGRFLWMKVNKIRYSSRFILTFLPFPLILEMLLGLGGGGYFLERGVDFIFLGDFLRGCY